ncbi:MAG: family 16 glycoside hydrolase [Pirellulales bacterium]
MLQKPPSYAYWLRHFLPLALLLLGIGTFVGCPSKSKDNPAVQTATTNSSSPTVSSESETSDAASDDDDSLKKSLLENRLTPEELAQGWVRLFDGHTFMGWDLESSKAKWKIEEGALVAEEGEMSLLCTTSTFADYELMVEFQADAKVNSGVFLRTPLEPTDPKSDCIELNIAPVDNPFPTASLVGRSRAEPDVVGPLEEEAWHTFHALLDGDHIQIWIDGKQVVDYVDTTRLVAGRIGLQFREGTVRFKNIRLRPILLNTMLPAQDLSQWQPSKTPSAFQLDKDGVLHIEKAKEAIEFLQPLQNFCFQTEFQASERMAPASIRLRGPFGNATQGYRCWLGIPSNRKDAKDPLLPTGSLQSQRARVTLGEEQGWTNLTIAAHGRHMATWVDGIQVIDWVDPRAPDEDPQKGYRAEAGSLLLESNSDQGEVSFRNMKCMPISQ